MVLYQPIDGYCYNSDSIFLSDFINRFSPKGELLDIGSGSGILGLLISKANPKITLNQCEIQDEFIFYSNKNSQINRINNTMFEGNFLNIEFEKKFDFIISNPPFWDSNVIQTENIQKNIARYNTHLPIDKFIAKVKSILKPRGFFIFCYDSKQLQNITHHLTLNRLNIETIQFIYPKIGKDSTIVFIQTRNNSKSFAKILPAFYSFDGEIQSDEAIEIYKKANTHSIKCSLK